MKNLNSYINEKLHLNKDSNFVSNDRYINIENNDDRLLVFVRDTILDYLEEHSWFDSNKSDFKIFKDTKIKNNVILDLSKSDNASYLISSIAKYIAELLTCKWDVNADSKQIRFFNL